MTLRQSGHRGCAKRTPPLRLSERFASTVPVMDMLFQGVSLVVAFGILAVLAVPPNDSRR